MWQNKWRWKMASSCRIYIFPFMVYSCVSTDATLLSTWHTSNMKKIPSLHAKRKWSMCHPHWESSNNPNTGQRSFNQQLRITTTDITRIYSHFREIAAVGFLEETKRRKKHFLPEPPTRSVEEPARSRSADLIQKCVQVSKGLWVSHTLSHVMWAFLLSHCIPLCYQPQTFL